MTDKNLYADIWDAKWTDGVWPELTDKQKNDLLEMAGKNCQYKTKARLRFMIQQPLGIWKLHGIYSRITLDDDGATYTCGQSWVDEMQTLRNCILDKR